VRDKREFGIGLTITLNAAGQRFVSRRSYDNFSLNKQGVPCMKDSQTAQHGVGLPNQSRKWVPRQKALTHDKQGVGLLNRQHSPIGLQPKAQPLQADEAGPWSIYKKGESSGSQSQAKAHPQEPFSC
jgi:hypothetical protein